MLLVFALPVLALISLYATAPQRASSMPGTLQAWIGKHNRTVTIFLIRGLLGA